MVTSEPMLEELARVLRRPKFKTSPAEIRRIALGLLGSAEVVNVKSEFRVVKDDPKDDIIIETAYDGYANFSNGRQPSSQIEELQENQAADCRRSPQASLD